MTNAFFLFFYAKFEVILSPTFFKIFISKYKNKRAILR